MEETAEETGRDKQPKDRTWLNSLGSTAWQTILGGVIVLVLGTAVAGLGFLVYSERLSAEPFLLLVGIIVGFLLGRLDGLF
jgi:hypothetical protein